MKGSSRSWLTSKLIYSRQEPRLCKTCLTAARRRFTSTTTVKSDPPPPPPSAGFARLTNRALLSVHGRDATHFLQGLTTSNIRPPSSSPSQPGYYSGFLNAQGRVLYDVFIYPGKNPTQTQGSPEDPSYLIDVDKAQANALWTHLKRFKLRAKLNIRTIDPEEGTVWATWNDDDTSTSTTSPDLKLEPPSIDCPDPRAPGMGRRIITFKNQPALQTLAAESSTSAYDLRRILRGVPQGHDEIISGDALPQESNMDHMSAVDFRKGCYVGQELTIRTHHTGVVRKRILPVQMYQGERPPEELKYDPYTSMEIPRTPYNIARLSTRGRSAGKWLKGVGNVGLALCRLEIMTDVKVTEEGGQWSPEHEFKINWTSEGSEQGTHQRELKVKAFVPEWHRNRVGVRDMHRQQEG
ncbi:MAG: hypothetical protein Q9183_005474 [Haloplaca sp. 2 TL-2023]